MSELNFITYEFNRKDDEKGTYDVRPHPESFPAVRLICHNCGETNCLFFSENNYALIDIDNRVAFAWRNEKSDEWSVSWEVGCRECDKKFKLHLKDFALNYFEETSYKDAYDVVEHSCFNQKEIDEIAEELGMGVSDEKNV